MLAIKYVILLLACVFFLGCANRGVPVDKNTIATKSITVVPTGKITYEVFSNRMGGAFALIGALAEIVATNEASSASEKVLEKEVPEEFIFKVATDELKKALSKPSENQIVVISPRVLSDKVTSEWVKDERREHLTKNPNLKSDLALEISFPRVGIEKTLRGNYAFGYILLRLIDIKTGRVLGSSSAINNGSKSGLLINSDEDSPQYIAVIRSNFESLALDLLSKAWVNLFDVSK